MADVLSQSEIDALLKSMQSGGGPQPAQTEQKEIKPVKEEVKYSKYDFYSPRKFTKDKVKILTNVFENYARIITSQINGIFRVMTDVTVREVQEKRYYEFVNSLHENDAVTLVDAVIQDSSKNLVPLMIYVSPGLVITLVERMLGGGEGVIKVKPEYRYSDVEIALYRRIVGYLSQALKDGFNNYISMEFKIHRIEDNPSMMQDVGLDETVAIIVLNVDVSGLAMEQIRICMPGTLLETIFQTIDSRKHLARGYSYEDNKDTILENIRDTLLPVTGQLGTVALDLNDIYHLKTGDVIDMSKQKDRDVTLYIGRQAWFSGKMGIYKKNVAVRINQRLYGEEESQEEPELAASESDTNIN